MDQRKYAGYLAEIAQLEHLPQACTGDETDTRMINRIGLEQRLKQARAKTNGADITPPLLC